MPEFVRRVVTKNNERGEAVLFSEDVAEIRRWPGADAGGATVWSTADVPADNSDADVAGATRDPGMTLHGGSVFRVTELGPGFATPMHRTLSIDYCMVLAGTLELVLDDGKTVALKEGDTVVQRGTNHAWRNPSIDTRCRFVVTMIDAQPVTVNGASLKATPKWRMMTSALRMMLKRTR